MFISQLNITEYIEILHNIYELVLTDMVQL